VAEHNAFIHIDPDPISSRMRAVLWITAPVGLRVSFCATRAILQEVAMFMRAPADGGDCEIVPSS
jgi:hypothetical protein